MNKNIDSKLEKYKYKFKTTTNPDKRNLYYSKITTYNNKMHGGNNNNIATITKMLQDIKMKTEENEIKCNLKIQKVDEEKKKIMDSCNIFSDKIKMELDNIQKNMGNSEVDNIIDNIIKTSNSSVNHNIQSEINLFGVENLM